MPRITSASVSLQPRSCSPLLEGFGVGPCPRGPRVILKVMEASRQTTKSFVVIFRYPSFFSVGFTALGLGHSTRALVLPPDAKPVQPVDSRRCLIERFLITHASRVSTLGMTRGIFMLVVVTTGHEV